MSEFKLFYREDQTLKVCNTMDAIRAVPKENVLWIDLNNVSEQIESDVEEFLKIYIQEEDEMNEIEFSSRYMETDNGLVLNSNYLSADYESENVSFILKNNTLVTVRDKMHRSFDVATKKLLANPQKCPSCYDLLVLLLEMRVDFDADLIEEMTSDISKLSMHLRDKAAGDDILIAITELQEKTMTIREHIIDRHRVCSNLYKSALLSAAQKEKMSILISDLNSLIEYTSFGFARLEYLQNTFLGIVNLEQNRIIKIFTVVSVVFLPPTLIASIYGMNFDEMPELHWEFGYLFALCLMVMGVIAILVIFKRKKWM